MPQPTPYDKEFSFTGFQSNNPNRPLPAQNLDNELAGIEAAINSAISAINDVRRDDGKLKNGVVTRESLSSEFITGLKPATLWQAGIGYSVDDAVSSGTAFYRCLVAHISQSDFANDLALGRWVLYADIGAVATQAQTARNEAVSAAATATGAASSASSSASAASASASSASSSASSASASASGAAAAAALYADFDERYLGEKTSLPTLDNSGNALQNGALVSLTGQTPSSLNGMYVRRGGSWQPLVAGAAGLMLSYRYAASAGQTSFSGPDSNGQTLGYTVGAIVVFVNGAAQSPGAYIASNGTSVVFGTPLANGDTVLIASFGSFTVADTWTKSEADIRYARLTGAAFTGGVTVSGNAVWHAGNFDPANYPRLPAVAAGVGQFIAWNTVLSAGYSLPSGGTWVAWWIGFGTGGTLAVGGQSTVAAGGTAIQPGTANVQYVGYAWRIA